MPTLNLGTASLSWKTTELRLLLLHCLPTGTPLGRMRLRPNHASLILHSWNRDEARDRLAWKVTPSRVQGVISQYGADLRPWFSIIIGEPGSGLTDGVPSQKHGRDLRRHSQVPEPGHTPGARGACGWRLRNPHMLLSPGTASEPLGPWVGSVPGFLALVGTSGSWGPQ